jgi:hypothetical protein
MTEPNSELHQFHIVLCRYAADHVAEHLNDLRVRDEDQLKYAGLFEYLKQFDSQGRMIGPDMSDLLLNDSEFYVLQCWAEALEVAESGQPVPTTLIPKWQPLYRRRAGDCFGELKDELGPTAAKRWLSDSEAFADQLEVDGLLIAEGVGIVRSWAREARRHLKMMGKDEFLPRPDGDYRTPTTLAIPRKPESKVARYLEKLASAASKSDDNKQYKVVMEETLAACETDDEVRILAAHEHITPFVESMRWAINDIGDVSGTKLITRVTEYNGKLPMHQEHQKRGANRKLCYVALKILARLGEHTPRESKAKRRS